MSSASKLLGGALTALTLLSVAHPVVAQDTTAVEPDTTVAEPDRAFVYRVEIDGAIQPASAEFLVNAITKAGDERADALIIELDTPGGLVDSTRDIIQAMLASRVPVVVYVSPGGARAGSAGVFITLAAHVAAMAPGTNIGAATPINIGGGDFSPGGPAPADSVAEEQTEGQSDLERKILNDTVAFIRTIAEKRGRNAEWAERAVREADAITETEALELNVIDLVVPNLAKLLDEIDGREVEVLDRTVTLATAQGFWTRSPIRTSHSS
jgi:membrane-bound serine protease (ClpP class)